MTDRRSPSVCFLFLDVLLNGSQTCSAGGWGGLDRGGLGPLGQKTKAGDAADLAPLLGRGGLDPSPQP